MDVRVISLTNETDADDPYEVISFYDFNGSYDRLLTETASPAVGVSWLGKLALALLLSSFVVVALAGNILVIVAVITDSNLRRTSNYFIVSLALADALVAAAVMTFAIANDVTGRWIFGARTCRIWMSADVMCSTASILNLCAISLDRYLHVRSPLHYDRLVTHRRSLAAIAVVWIMSALISFLPIHLGWHRVDGPTVASAMITVNQSSTTASHIHSLVQRPCQWRRQNFAPGGARACGARVPKFVMTKSPRSESHLALGLQKRIWLKIFATACHSNW